MAMTATLYLDDAAERRDAGRRVIRSESTLRDAEARPHVIMLHDLSVDGCLVEGGLALAPGAFVSIGLGGVGRRDAAVVRADGACIGFRFLAPLSPDQLAAAFAVSTVIEGDFGAAMVTDELPEPYVEKWPRAVRLTFLIGLASALWSAVLHLA